MMIGSPSFGHAVQALNRRLPSQYFLTMAALPSRVKLHDILIVESDGEFWFNTDTLDKFCKLEGLTEHQENVTLYTGHLLCPGCGANLAHENGAVGFYDYDVDHVRIQKQFACKKCRHQWGPRASGPRDSAVVASPCPPREPSAPRAPRARTAGGPSVRDLIHAIINALRDEIGIADWATFRKVAVERCTAAGINPGSTTTELPRWRKTQA